MDTIYYPVMNTPGEDSKQWYKSFYNSYNLSQLTGITLLSYLETFIQAIDTRLEYRKRDELIKDGTIDPTSGEIIDIDKFKSHDIKEFIDDIIEQVFQKSFSNMKHVFNHIGFDISENRKSSNINLDNLLNQTNADNWYNLIKGFLNIWEFQFLYSIVENCLKELLNNQKIRTDTIIKEISKKYKNTDFESIFYEKSKKTIDECDNIWKLYTSFRNIYAHSNGILSNDSKGKIVGKIDKFNRQYKIKSLTDSLLRDDLFKKETFIVGKFYLIKDCELNIFRNFVISLMESLDEYTRNH